MEILQTIWTALTTSNEELIQIMISPFALIELIIMTHLFTNILNISVTRKKKYLYITSLFICNTICTILTRSSLLSFLNMILYPLFAMLIFKISFLKGIMADIISFLVIAIFDPLSVNILTSIFNISYNSIAFIPIYRVLYLLCLYFFMCLLYYVIKKFNFNITIFDGLNKKDKAILIFNIILGIITIFIQRYFSNKYSENIPFVTIATLSLLIYFFISMYSLIRTTKLELTEQSLEEAKLYNKSLKILHDNVRAFKHDFSNIVQAIGRIYWYK